MNKKTAKVKCLSGYHSKWVENRIKFILNYFNYDLTNKRILELGAHFGDIGGNLVNFGAQVTSVEGRPEHVNRGEKLYSKTKWRCVDLDIEEWGFENKYDIILHLGLLYHLKNPDYYLIESQKRCDHFFLESQVIDNSNEEICKIKDPDGPEHGDGQGINAEAQLSVKYIENRLDNFQRFDLKELGGGGHHYDWKAKNDNTYRNGRRRFWVA